MNAHANNNILHAFETKSGAEMFEKVTGKTNCTHKSIGWRLGQVLPDDKIIYLWTAQDETGDQWVHDVAATTRAALKRPIIPNGFKDVVELLTDLEGPEYDDINLSADEKIRLLREAVRAAQPVPSTNDRTDRDV